MDLTHFGSKMSYKVPGPTSVCVETGLLFIIIKLYTFLIIMT